MSDIDNNQFDSASHLNELLEIQQGAIEKIALSVDLKEALGYICNGIEQIFSSTQAMSSILLLRNDTLYHGAAPSLPKAYCQAIDGVVIGASVGSCGTAAFSKERYIAKEIGSDSKWQNFKDLAMGFGLHACWSTPILSTDYQVLGTFAVYYAQPRSPSEAELRVIDRFSHLTGLAIEKHRAFKREVELNKKLRLSHSKVEAMTSVLPDQIFIYDQKAQCIDYYGSNMGPHCAPKKSLTGKLILSGESQSENCSCQEAIERTIESGTLKVFEYQRQKSDGLHYYESRITPIEGYGKEAEGISHALWLERDITERKEAAEKIKELAYQDILTNLPNRRYLLNHLKTTITALIETKKMTALLYIDLNNFKSVNDTLGHTVGDNLLKDVCIRLSTSLNPNDTFSRIGGDEFVIILSEFFDEEQPLTDYASQIADQLLNVLNQPFSLCGRNITVEASVGITLMTDKDKNADEILMCADTAMYSAKRSTHSDYCFFDPSIHESLKSRFTFESELKESIKLGQIVTYFQPQIGSNGRLKGAEALVRWLHPERGLIPPLEFIAVAEEIGVINDLQRIVMEDSCQLLRHLKEKGMIDHSFSLSINISAAQGKNVDLCTELVQFFNSESISPCHITLELTESMLVEDVDNAVRQMQGLKQEGFRVSIDDFGTGYSSLAYLQVFPINELKIDKSFVDNMKVSQVGTGIVDTIITLANHLKVDVVAEGIEEKNQADFFRAAGITMQGYYFARPMPAKEFYKWVLNQPDVVAAVIEQ
ncbi:sensor domain-containing phosphodiesterase [Vibrio genomosp. F10 str. 9ZC157]|uniref:sensor domain-containing phosphodiesterase n=1 Tax=Vibrio genomosp. F10 TaxID=723171 RepID=UPI00031E6B8C|nr:EAL domain-containing protein [Vibrio genomosp. F10]OEE94789.1 hypothetical protein A1QM_05745 [Vibrio genomosp. F10 str. 9ZC157]